ncbi:MAG: O-antigen ligase family protein [Acidobacteria bacterium]|nr:O-antigen ligase family protein [Acidobacteriota bacterium]
MKGSISILCALALGYWSTGKSFGYLGYYPILIGEISLAILFILALLHPHRYKARHLSAKFTIALFLIIISQAIYSWFVLDQSSIEIVRSIAPFYYCFFAYAAYNTMRALSKEPTQRFVPSRLTLNVIGCLVLASLTVSFISNTYFLDATPNIPGTSIPILYYKATDAFMPLSILLLLWSRGILSNFNGIWALGLSLVGSARSRTVLLTLALVLILVFRPKPRALIPAAFILCCLTVILGLDLKINMGYREISAQQYAANILSFVSPSAASEIDFNGYQNSEWRRRWWASILNDSISDSYIFIGRGWGTNLALDYGIVTDYDVATNSTVLRNPHNMFFSTLGRGGWGSAVLWAFCNGSLLWSLIAIWRRSRTRAPGLHLLSQICTIYLTVSLLQANSDVFLESPQNSIPHWIIFGAGWYVCEEWTRRVSLENRISSVLRPALGSPLSTTAAGS